MALQIKLLWLLASAITASVVAIFGQKILNCPNSDDMYIQPPRLSGA
jgi:hypothetical protein